MFLGACAGWRKKGNLWGKLGHLHLHSIKKMSCSPTDDKISLNLYLIYIIKKAWERTCYSSHGLRLSHCPKMLNEQRRSPRRAVYTIHPTDGVTLYMPPWTSTVAEFQTFSEFARFQSVKNKASSKRLFSYIVFTITYLLPPSAWGAPHVKAGFGNKRMCKVITIFLKKHSIFPKNAYFGMKIAKMRAI